MQNPPLLSYATPKPVLHRLVVVQTPDGGVSISLADAPPRWKLWREVVAPAVIVPMAVAGAAGMFMSAARLRPDALRVSVQLAAIAGCVLFVLYALWDWWQNGGVVTEIRLEDDWLFWSKLNLWGARTNQWRRASVTRADGGAGVALGSCGLKVYRSTGLPLTAFVDQQAEELSWAASALNDALSAR